MAEEFKVGDYVAWADQEHLRDDFLVGCKGTIVRIDTYVYVMPDSNDKTYLNASSMWRERWENQKEIGTSAEELVLIKRGGAPEVSSGKRRNNDNRTNCYSCGALTEPVDNGLPGSKMRICSKCKK